ncbi:hypothetical protein QJS04_geneDACA009470 [Acorus gramineus]|uniref:Uncharacterized protein n=1 Tax=Acorus gramineus TaxID=55184 RepID=A0AAV9AI36_ACOGR|nr:hypothetical protein QJS04_geneDACA009470 [Acorus gramineus]
MDKGGAERDIDDFEMLSDEISNASSPKYLSEESSGHTDSSREMEMVPTGGKSSPSVLLANFYKSPRAMKNGSDSAFHVSSPFERSIIQSPETLFNQKIKNVESVEGLKMNNGNIEQNEANFSDGQLLTSALGNLSLHDALTALPNGGFFSDEYQTLPQFNQPLSGLGSERKASSPFFSTVNGRHSTNHIFEALPDRNDVFNIPRYGMKLNEAKPGSVMQPERESSDYCMWGPRQTRSVYSGVPLHGFDFSTPSIQHSYLMNPQTVPSAHVPNSMQGFLMPPMEEEMYGGLYPTQASGNMSSRQYVYDEPVSLGQMNLGCFLNKTNYLDDTLMGHGGRAAGGGGNFCRFYAQGYCGKGERCAFIHGPRQTSWNDIRRGCQIFDKGAKQIFPQRRNSVSALKSNLSMNDPGRFNNGTAGMNGLPMSNIGSFQLDNMDFGTTRAPQAQKYSSVDEVAGKIYVMAKDRCDCRLLQNWIEEGNTETFKKIFFEIIDNVIELMTHPFGNYLVQKLLERCNDDQRLCMLYEVTRRPREFIKVSCDMHGTRAVQKLIETRKGREQSSLIARCLKHGIITLMGDINGNHVAQSCLTYLEPEDTKFLLDAAIVNCVDLAANSHGCVVLQKCFPYLDDEQTHYLISELASNALYLSQDPFGNYMMQYILELKELPWVKVKVMEHLEGNYIDMSMHKCSSNVVERCMLVSNDEQRARIVKELLDSPRLADMMQDPYGNYVIQYALKVTEGALQASILRAIRAHVPVLRNNQYGKKVLTNEIFKRQL